MAKKFYITNAIAYSSGKPHIGHLYEYLLSDTLVRFKRLLGFDCYMLNGMDEHGEKILECATKNNMQPQQWVDHINDIFQDLFHKYDISYNGFIRTTDKNHMEACQKAFLQLQKDGFIYLGNFKTLYCVSDEEAYTETEAIKKEDGYYCRLGHKLITKEEPSYFFKMSEYTNWIKEFLEKNNYIQPQSRLNELMNSFINKGILDLSISRTSYTWGITIPNDTKHVLYVWLDALLNYITALGYQSDNDELYKKYWADPESEVVHIVGRDIIRFHAIYWPIFLKCLNVREPNKVISHGFVMAEDGRKMSKSFGNVIDPMELLNEFDSDTVRYYVIKEFTPTEWTDVCFSKKILQETYNADLANIYGNLVSRFIGMVKKYNDGVIPKASENISVESNTLLEDIINTHKQVENYVNSYDLGNTVKSVLDLAKSANKYVEVIKPWELAKNNDNEGINNFLNTLANAIKAVLTYLKPLLPKSIDKLINQLNFNNVCEHEKVLNFDNVEGTKVNDSEIIFARK